MYNSQWIYAEAGMQSINDFILFFLFQLLFLYVKADMILTQERSFMNTDRIYSKKSEFLFLRTPVRLVSDFCLALDGQHKRSVFINRQASQGIPFTQHFPNETFLTLRTPFLFLDVMLQLLQSIFCIIHLPTFSISKKGFWKRLLRRGRM